MYIKFGQGTHLYTQCEESILTVVVYSPFGEVSVGGVSVGGVLGLRQYVWFVDCEVS